MSDFLSNLIQRHEQPKAAVRPRLPSLFETASAEAATDRAPENTAIELAVETDAPATPAAPRRGNAAQPLPKPAATLADDAPPLRSAFTTAREQPQVPENTPTHPPVESIDAQPSAFLAPPPEIPRAATVKPAIATETADASAPAIHAPVVTRTVQSVEVTERIRVAEPPAPRRPVGDAAPQTPASTIRAIPQPPLPEPSRASPFEMPQPEGPRQTRREAQREAHDAQSRVQAEPVIHVSIGRIEIRASEERETRARKSDAPSPVMTLDAYLKSRAKR